MSDLQVFSFVALIIGIPTGNLQDSASKFNVKLYTTTHQMSKYFHKYMCIMSLYYSLPVNNKMAVKICLGGFHFHFS